MSKKRKTAATFVRPATITVSQACDYSGLSRSTLYNLMNGHNGQQLESRLVGRRRLIVVDSLDELLGLNNELEAA